MQYIRFKRIIKASKSLANANDLNKEYPLQISLYSESYVEFHDGDYVILDFGKEISGGIRIFTGFISNDANVRIRFGESVGEACSELGYKGSCNDHSPRDMNVKISTLSDLTFGQSGFRFVRIDFKGEFWKVRNVVCAVDMDERKEEGYFVSNDLLVNKIWKVASHTLRLNLHNGLFWDGVKRDRLCWIGDTYPEMRAANCLYKSVPEIINTLDFTINTTGKDGYMIWFVIPEEYIKPSNGYDYTTILIPMYTNIYDVKVAKDVNLTLVNGSWVSSLKQSTFLKVNQYNNNVAEGSLYRTMLQFDMPFYNQNMSGINIAVEENDLGEKMTLNGVAVKNIKDFFASYYDAGKDGQMIIVKIPESALVPSNDYHLPTLFMPKGTLIYDAVTKNDVSLVLNHGSWYEADEKWHTQPDPIDEYDYSFAIVGDTQIVNDLKPDLYPYIYDWVVDNAENKKIQHVIGLGDITNRNLEEEWGRARDSFDKLEEIGLTHTQVRGNHDQPKEYEEFFQADDFYKDGILGYYKTIANSYRIVSVGEINYLMLTLDYGPDDDVLKWADGICEKYDDYNVIVVTHGYLYKDGTTLDVHDSIPPSLTGGVNNGDQIWDKFVKKHENITMVLSGHIECDNIVISQAVGDNGNIVTQVLIDPQGLDKIAPSGMVAMFYFSNGGQTIQVEYYSPISGLYETTSATKKFTVPVIETKPHIHEWEDEWTIDFNPTCTESGSKSHHCKGVTTISPIGHIAGEPVKENVVEATHNKAGSYDLVTYCTGCYMEMSRETITVSPIPHDYDDITYTWSNDYSSCTATATCECGDIVNETVSATISTIEASCTEEGTKTYTATFDNDIYVGQHKNLLSGIINFDNDIFETQTYSENIEKVDHSYGDAVYTWSTNHQICTATLVCSECGKEISESVFVNVSVNSPTCSEDGIKTYTATFDNPLFEEQQFSEIIPATGHNYQNPTYTWDLDSMTCTATATCECGDEMSETVQISVLDDRYEADFSNSFFSKQTKDREKEPVNKSTGCGGSIESMSFIIPLFAMGLAFRFYRKRFKN